MYFVSPRAGELYYLRVLLCNVAGATSWADLRTVEGVVHPTFKEACVALGFLQDDREWDSCLKEATETQMPSSLRYLFAIILEHNKPEDPAKLWERHRKAMMEDHAYRADQAGLAMSEDDLENAALWAHVTLIFF